jgi:hypothetical protein
MQNKVPASIRVIILAVISLGLFGFQHGPEYGQEEINNLQGWIEFSISGSAFADDGLNTFYVVWHYERDYLPIALLPDTGHMIVLSKDLYSVMEEQGTHAEGLGTTTMMVPIQWEISGILYQDCSVEFFINEIWFPGTLVACISGFGCSLETVDPEYFTHAGSMTIPYEQGSGSIPWDTNKNIVSGDLTIIIHSMTVGDENDCSYIRQLP